MSENRVLAPLDAADLISRGLVGAGATQGFIRINKRKLNRSSDKENEEFPLSAKLDSLAAKEAFATIPLNLISYDTLIHVGFSAAKATQLWTRWTNWPAGGPRRETDADDGGLVVTFKDLMVGWLKNEVDVISENTQQWQACLQRCGIAPEAQEAIMDPHFRYLRLSNSCLFWIDDTIRMRYRGLKEIQRASRDREMELSRVTTRPGGGAGGGGQGGWQGGTLPAAGSSYSGTQGQRSFSGLQREGVVGISPDLWGSARATAARNAPGHIVLYRGMDQRLTRGLFDDAGRVANVGRLLSRPPGDFSGTRALFYFTPDYQVAEYYATYCKRRADCDSVVIVCIRIPNAAIERLLPPEIQRIYWPSNEWKELIWRCRTAQALPTYLRKYRQATLVIGTISRKPNDVYQDLDSWQQVTDDYLLRVGAAGEKGPAVQYVFSGDEEGRDFLTEHVGQNIEVFGYPKNELESWLAANPPLRGQSS